MRFYMDREGQAGFETFLAEDAKVISVSELARIEVRNVLLRDPGLGAVERFERDLAEGDRVRNESVDWPRAFQQAESLARQFSAVLKPGGHDQCAAEIGSESKNVGNPLCVTNYIVRVRLP